MKKLQVFCSFLYGVDNRTRTCDNQIHNLALYQLNYIHHIKLSFVIQLLERALPVRMNAHTRLTLKHANCGMFFNATRQLNYIHHIGWGR